MLFLFPSKYVFKTKINQHKMHTWEENLENKFATKINLSYYLYDYALFINSHITDNIKFRGETLFYVSFFCHVWQKICECFVIIPYRRIVKWEYLCTLCICWISIKMSINFYKFKFSAVARERENTIMIFIPFHWVVYQK